MDQVKIGKFIAALRRQAGLTQEGLGEKIGVTNKTISRWENGNYMPDIEMLQLLSQELGVSIHELLAGERVSNEPRRESSVQAPNVSAFTFEERKAYFIRKWRREHIPLFVFLLVILIAAYALPFVIRKPWLVGAAPLIGLIEHCYQNNRMMIDVENHLYG